MDTISEFCRSGKSENWKSKIELYTPTMARGMPMKNRRRSSFSATNATQGSKDCLHQTKHPNAMPATERCPGQHKEGLGKLFHFYSFRFAFGHGCDCHGYADFMLKQFNFQSSLLAGNVMTTNFSFTLDYTNGIDPDIIGFLIVVANSLANFQVWAYRVNPQQVSVGDPVGLSKRLDGNQTLRFS
jgi:hypothetical protein